MTNNKTLVIIGKPLQLFNALSVLKQMKIESSAQIQIVNNFKGAKDLTVRFNIFEHNYNEINFVDTFDEAYSLLAKDGNIYQNLLIDSDVGLKKYFQLYLAKKNNANINICVYEEGWGVYRSDLYKGLKRFIFQILGIGHTMGGCSKTDYIYIYDKERYKNSLPLFAHKAVEIRQPLGDFLVEKFLLFSYLFNLRKAQTYLNVKNDNIHLVLDTKYSRSNFASKLNSVPGAKFWKFHPHQQQTKDVPGFIMIDNALPAEILLIHLSAISKKIYVYHFNSSTEDYIQNKNIIFKRLDLMV
jgi:hypothetical protein